MSLGFNSAESRSQGIISRTCELSPKSPEAPALVQVRVPGGEKLAAEGVNPIARLAEKALFVALVPPADGAAVFGHVGGLEGLAIVKDRRVKAAVEVGVGLDEEMVGEHAAAVAHQNAQHIGRLGAVALPGLKPQVQPSGQAKAQYEQADQDQKEAISLNAWRGLS